MKDGFGREIDYLRISVTDRCNLRCRYCMPPAGISHVPNDKILSYEEIVRIVEASGIRKVRITGGEPLIRRDIAELIRKLDVDDLSMTTNGVLLKDCARQLRDAGLDRVNISLDTLDRERFKYITGSDSLNSVLDGIQAALKAELNPVKINVLLLGKEEVNDFIRLTIENPLHVRFIEFMPIGNYKASGVFLDIFNSMEPAEVKGNGPARYFRVKGAMGTVGFISPMSNKFCSGCNRLRLTSTGFLKTCLYSNAGVNLKGQKDLPRLIRNALLLKPKEHHLETAPIECGETSMCQIGG